MALPTFSHSITMGFNLQCHPFTRGGFWTHQEG